MAKLTDEQAILQELRDPHTRRKAFEVVVSTYSRRLYWQIHHIVQCHEDADDVLQNTMVKAWKGIATFEGNSSLSTWLYRIAYNESITWIKQKRGEASIDDDDFVGQSTFVADDYFDGNEAQELLQQAVSTLPPKQKMVFCMKYFEEKKYEEISEIVGTSIGALKASFHLAVEKITKYVKSRE